MNRKATSVKVEDKQTKQTSVCLPHTFHRRSKEKGRFGRALSFSALICAMLMAFWGRATATASSGSSNEKRSLDMSSAATATDTARIEDENRRSTEEDNHRSILATVLEQSDSVESVTDNLVEQATSEPKEFRRNFESKVSSLKGFRTSLTGLVKSL